MSCPNDGATLVMSERSGIEIDYCPTCRGVWLDRGELDKIIERSQAEFGPAGGAGQQPQAPPPSPAGSPWSAPPPYPQQQPYGHGYGSKPHKRRKSFLEELFD
jgi:Zn-finger nucleic acid-binding protein